MELETEDQTIFELRKEFIHTGKFPPELKEPIETYHQIVHFIDRLLLHILGYTGTYLDITERYAEKQMKYLGSEAVDVNSVETPQ